MRLLRVLVLLALVWCAVWAALALALPGAAARLQAALAAQGWELETGPVRARGFPFALGAAAGPVAAVPPDGAGTVRAGGLALSAPLLAPLTLEARGGGGVEVVLPDAALTLRAAAAQVAASLSPTPALTFRGATLRLSAVAARLPGGEVRAGRVAARLDARPGEPAVLGLEAEIADIALPPAILARIASGGGLPGGLPRLVLAAEAVFTGPWDRAALGTRPQPMRLTLRRAAAEWGRVAAEAEGLVRIGPDGIPEGEMRLALPDAAAALGLAVAAGLLPEAMAARIARLAPARAGDAAGPRRFALTFTFRDGRVFLGGSDLGPAPAIRLP